MTQGIFTISDTTEPTAIIPQWNTVSDPQQLTNTGPNTIWLGNDSTVNILSGFPLNSTATKIWDGNQPLYAVCAPGLPSTLQMIDNIGNLSDPLAIATGLFALGLPAAIAAAIRVEGVPIIDAMAQLLQTFNTNIAAMHTSAQADISRYQSLHGRFTAVRNPLGLGTPQRWMLWLDFYTAGGVLLRTVPYGWWDHNGRIELTIPCYGERVVVRALGDVGGVVNNAPLLFYTLYGSYRPLNPYTRTLTDWGGISAQGTTEWQNAIAAGMTSGLPGSDAWFLGGAVPIGFTNYEYFSGLHAGPATLTFGHAGAIAGAGVDVILSCIIGGNDHFLGGWRTYVAGNHSIISQPVMLPTVPFRVNVSNRTGAVSAGTWRVGLTNNRIE